MTNYCKQFWYLYFALVILVLIRIIPFFYPDSRTWGFNHLQFLPTGYSVAFFGIATIALILPFVKKSERWSEKFIDWFSIIFFECPKRFLYRAIFVFVMVCLFIIFAAPTHFLGDGYILINSFSADVSALHNWDEFELYKWSEIGSARLMILIRSFLGPETTGNSLLAFQIVSIVSGAAAIWLLFAISKLVGQNNTKRLLLFFVSFFSGVLLLFFGYVEFYHFIWVFMLAFVYYSQLELKQGRGLLFAWIFLAFGIVLHLQMVLFFASGIFLLLTNHKNVSLYIRYRKIIIVGMVIVSLAVIAVIIYKYLTDLYIENIFLPFISGKPVDPNYAIFSLSHLGDIVNEILLVSPLLFILLLLGLQNIKNLFRGRENIYFILSIIPCLMFLFMVDPLLEMPRDWDLFSMTMFPLILLLIYNLSDKYNIIIKKIMPSIGLILFISVLPFLITNLNRASSVKYMGNITTQKSEKTLPGFCMIYDYYIDFGPKNKSDSMLEIWKNNYPTKHFERLASDELNNGDLMKAELFINKMKNDKFNANLHRLRSRLCYLKGDYDSALAYIEKTIQVRRYNANNYGDRAKINIALKNTEIALDDLRHGYALHKSSTYIIDGLINTFTEIGFYDSSIYYSKMRLAEDSTHWLTCYKLALQYYRINDTINTLKYIENLAKYNIPNRRYREKLQELLQLKKQLDNNY